MAADYTPLGGGRIGKAEAFDVLADAIGLAERPISDVRADLFRLVFNLGGYALGELDRNAVGVPPLALPGESWQMLGCLYEALHGLEQETMREVHAANLKQFLTERAAEAEREDARPL